VVIVQGSGRAFSSGRDLKVSNTSTLTVPHTAIASDQSSEWAGPGAMYLLDERRTIKSPHPPSVMPLLLILSPFHVVANFSCSRSSPGDRSRSCTQRRSSATVTCGCAWTAPWPSTDSPCPPSPPSQVRSHFLSSGGHKIIFLKGEVECSLVYADIVHDTTWCGIQVCYFDHGQRPGRQPTPHAHHRRHRRYAYSHRPCLCALWGIKVISMMTLLVSASNACNMTWCGIQPCWFNKALTQTSSKSF
jgi:hypothetical protein